MLTLAFHIISLPLKSPAITWPLANGRKVEVIGETNFSSVWWRVEATNSSVPTCEFVSRFTSLRRCHTFNEPSLLHVHAFLISLNKCVSLLFLFVCFFFFSFSKEYTWLVLGTVAMLFNLLWPAFFTIFCKLYKQT